MDWILFMRLLLFLSAFWTLCSTFNVDLAHRLVYTGQRDTWFGYDVDLYFQASQIDVVVGAPKAQSSQPGVRRGGAVYRCAADKLRCEELDFDLNGNNREYNGSTLVESDSKSHQWFGATVTTSKTRDLILACAPRYTYFFDKFKKIEPAGTCFLAKDSFRDVQEFSPCRQKAQHGYHRLGYGMAGFSAQISSHSNMLFIGAPGAWYWQGALMVQSSKVPADLIFNEEGPDSTDDTYLGYSVAAGDFNGDQIDDAAVGIPRGNNLTGMVALFDYDLQNIRNITGEQLGSYFGASIAVSDIDGDGFDDLIIGAPLFVDRTVEKGLVKTQYEVGKVYVYFQGQNHEFEDSASIVGSTEWSRFGFDVAAVGDLNSDGYNDFIVGAPYDGDNRKGAVYVYNGMAGGFREKFSQRILAEEVRNDISTFGFSVGGGIDVDENEYPDVVVGAYKSSHAILLKTRPVVSVTGTIKVMPSVIDLKEKCNITRHRFPCASFELCVKFGGKGSPPTLDLELLISMDAKKGSVGGRALSVLDMKRVTVQASINREEGWCDSYWFYVKDDIRDKLSPIYIHANYSLVPVYSQTIVQPILDKHVPEVIIGKVEIQKNCGPDKVCIPDLQLDASVSPGRLIIGRDGQLNVTATIRNSKEDSYESRFYLNVPAGLEYIGYKSLSKTAVLCSVPEDYASRDRASPYAFACDVGNPLPGRRVAKVRFEFSTANVDSSVGVLALNVSVNSTNEETEDTVSDNDLLISVPLDVDATIFFRGKSIPETSNFETRRATKEMTFDDEVGPLITHVYEVGNQGPSSIKSAEVDIFWPSFTQDNENLLYLIYEPIIQGNVTVACSAVQKTDIAFEGLKIKTTKDEVIDSNRQKRTADPDPEPDPEKDSKSALSPSSNAFQGLVRKLKKSAGDITESAQLSTRLRNLKVNCSEVQCTQIHCETGRMEAGRRVTIYMGSRLWVNTLVRHKIYDAVISSFAIAKITGFPHGQTPGIKSDKSLVVSTAVNSKDRTLVRRGIPFWLLLIAILAGITFLILVILLLWRLGFFKRNRPPREQAQLSRPPAGEFYGYSGYSSGYGPASMYSEEKYGPKL